MSETSPSPQTRRLAGIFGLIGASDMIAGVVLLVLGQTRDNNTMLIVGAVLAVAGLAGSAWSFRIRNAPISL